MFAPGPAAPRQHPFAHGAWRILEVGGHRVVPAVQETIQAHCAEDLHDLPFAPVFLHPGHQVGIDGVGHGAGRQSKIEGDPLRLAVQRAFAVFPDRVQLVLADAVDAGR